MIQVKNNQTALFKYRSVLVVPLSNQSSSPGRKEEKDSSGKE